jgi:MoaA/NifB/PqqE/SkfB family radical SAM enzyme
MYVYNGERRQWMETVSNNYQDPPNSIQVEFVEGCNLACSFCGIQAIRDNGADGPNDIHGKKSGPYKNLTIQTAEAICDQIREANWNPRIEFAMHGEPTMHPFFVEMVGLFRKKLPKTSLMMTSNGGGLLKDTEETVNKLMDAGINVLFLDNYERIKIVDKIKERYNGPHPVYEYPSDRQANPHRRRRHDDHDIVVGMDLTLATNGTHAQVSNHAGSAFPLNYNQSGKRCAKPFRELSIRWDGSVAVCCNDWIGWYKCGNLHQTNLSDIWQGDAFHAARQKLYHGQRNFGPCNGCDNVTLRNGLLPDRMGRQSLPEPDAQTEEHIQKALGNGTYTPKVKKHFDFI